MNCRAVLVLHAVPVNTVPRVPTVVVHVQTNQRIPIILAMVHPITVRGHVILGIMKKAVLVYQIVPHQKHVRRWAPVGRVRITNVPRTKVHSVIRLVRPHAEVITQAHVRRTHHVHITPVTLILGHSIMAVRVTPVVCAQSAPYHVILDTIKMAVRVLAVPRSVPVAI